MAGAFTGRRSALRSRFTMEGHGLERIIVPGTEAESAGASTVLPPGGLPQRLFSRILLLRFTSADGAGSLGVGDITVDGATVRWIARPSEFVAISDPAMQPTDEAWLSAFAARLVEAPGSVDRWLVVHTEADLPTTIEVALPRGGVLEDGLTSLSVVRSGTETVAADADWLNAVDVVVVADTAPFVSERLRQRVLFIGFENAFAIADLTPDSITITGGNRIPTVDVTMVWPLDDVVGLPEPSLSASERARLTDFAAQRAIAGDLGNWAVALLASRGDFSAYTLSIGDPRFDEILSAVPLRLKIDCFSGFDCQPGTVPRPAPEAGPEIDYMSRDFPSFRRLMLDRMALLGATNANPNPVELTSTLVELVAHRADQLAHMQDAVATEAYLHTARFRRSVRRHVRALDYQMHEGVTARAFVHVRAAAGVDSADVVETGETFLTRISPDQAVLPTSVLSGPLPTATEAFHAILPPRRIADALNAIPISGFGESDWTLPKGATSCTLEDPTGALLLSAGDTLVFEAIDDGPGDAALTLRHVVRLTAEPVPREDTLLGLRTLTISWYAADALPFDFTVLRAGQPRAVARGNLVLVQHGTPQEEQIALMAWGNRGRLIADLNRKGLAWSAPAPEADGAWAANEVISQAPQEALPDITLTAESDGEVWRPQRDLLASDRSAAEFCVEMEEDGSARLRFGDDVTGRSPAQTDRFTARYRTGNGTAGNVGAGTIAHIVSDRPAAAGGILALHNPLPATGGTEPETIAHARAAAPYAFRQQERAVTLADWAEVTERGDHIQRAAARLKWTGSWHTVHVHVDPANQASTGEALLEAERDRLEPFRLAGYGLKVIGPVYVPLDIALGVCVAADAWPEDVLTTLSEEFGTGFLADGRTAFFHPDNYTFGDSVFLSQIVARAMAVPGVRWVDTRSNTGRNRFRRWSSEAPDALDDGVLTMGEFEIAQCDSDPSVPDRGRVEFVVEGVR